MPSILTPVRFPIDGVRQQYSSVKAFLEDDFLGQGTLCVAERFDKNEEKRKFFANFSFFSQLLWADSSNDLNRQGVAIDYPKLTMHGIVTHDPKYSEEHLVVIVEKSTNNDDDEDQSDSPVEDDAIETVNYRFVMSSNDDLKNAYQTIADCQALHPDPSDDLLEDDEVGSGWSMTFSFSKSKIDIFFFSSSDIDYGEDDDDEPSNGNGDGDPYGYEEHFSSTNRPENGSNGDTPME